MLQSPPLPLPPAPHEWAKPELRLLYESDNFVVVHTEYQALPHPSMRLLDVFKEARKGTFTKNGFEIVDKRTNLEVFLTNDWAGAFMTQIASWRDTVPDQDTVEEALEGYCQLAQLPLVMH